MRLEFEDRCKGAETAAACEPLDGGSKRIFKVLCPLHHVQENK